MSVLRWRIHGRCSAYLITIGLRPRLQALVRRILDVSWKQSKMTSWFLVWIDYSLSHALDMVSTRCLIYHPHPHPQKSRLARRITR